MNEKIKLSIIDYIEKMDLFFSTNTIENKELNYEENKKFIGFELDEQYYELVKKRIDSMQ